MQQRRDASYFWFVFGRHAIKAKQKGTSDKYKITKRKLYDNWLDRSWFSFAQFNMHNSRTGHSKEMHSHQRSKAKHKGTGWQAAERRDKHIPKVAEDMQDRQTEQTKFKASPKEIRKA